MKQCDPAPKTVFCLAIEELEAWLLGDLEAVTAAYPRARRHILQKYEPDALCGTWELLADAVCPERASGLKRKGYAAVGARKREWAEAIAPLIDLDRHRSPSLRYFVRKVLEFC